MFTWCLTLGRTHHEHSLPWPSSQSCVDVLTGENVQAQVSLLLTATEQVTGTAGLELSLPAQVGLPLWLLAPWI